MKESPLACDTCNVVATSASQLAVHIDGKRHKRLTAIADLQNLDETQANLLDSSEDLDCKLCNVKTPSPLHHQYHLRGQKHQRMDKQNKLMEASEQLAKESVASVLIDTEADTEVRGNGQTDEILPGTNDHRLYINPENLETKCGSTDYESANSAASSHIGDLGDPGEENNIQIEVGRIDDSFPETESTEGELRPKLGNPLISPFEESASADVEEQLQSQNSAQNQPELFNPVAQRDSSEKIGENGSTPVFSTTFDSSHFGAGGSFSSPATHFCHACGVRATSYANLQDHLQGRKHARRIQYLSRQLPGGDLSFTFPQSSGQAAQLGGYGLPTSMDFSSHLGDIARVQASPHAALADRLTPFRSRHSRHFSFDSSRGLHNRESRKVLSEPQSSRLSLCSDSVKTETPVTDNQVIELETQTEVKESQEKDQSSDDIDLNNASQSSNANPNSELTDAKEKGAQKEILGVKGKEEVAQPSASSDSYSEQSGLQSLEQQRNGRPQSGQSGRQIKRDSKPRKQQTPVNYMQQPIHEGRGPPQEYPPAVYPPLPPFMTPGNGFQPGWHNSYAAPPYPIMYSPQPMMLPPGYSGYMPSQYMGPIFYTDPHQMYQPGSDLPHKQQHPFEAKFQGQLRLGHPQDSTPGPQSQLYNCELCDVKMNELGLLEDHIRGRQHRRRLQNQPRRQN